MCLFYNFVFYELCLIICLYVCIQMGATVHDMNKHNSKVTRKRKADEYIGTVVYIEGKLSVIGLSCHCFEYLVHRFM